MSKKLLYSLNGNTNSKLKKFLDSFDGEPRIAWYPSAGQDFRALMYLDPSFSKLHPATEQEPAPPDFFLFTDFFPWEYSSFLDSERIYSDDNTRVNVEHIEELPRLNLPLHKELQDPLVALSGKPPKGSSATDRVVFLEIKIRSNKLGKVTYPVLYAFGENETFFAKKMIPNDAIMTHIIHVRYGGGCGGGGSAGGGWIPNVLKKLKCELFVTDGRHYWQSGDDFALKLCPDIPKTSDAILKPIRTIDGKHWSNHGDVSWNLVE